MESFPQDRMAAVNNYIAIMIDPALFRTPSHETAANACKQDVDETHDLSTVSTALLEAELAARRREQQNHNNADRRAAARAAFQQEAKVLADWYAVDLRQQCLLAGKVVLRCSFSWRVCISIWQGDVVVRRRRN